MSIDINKKITDINNFLNKIYFPVLQKHHGLTQAGATDIAQRIVNRINQKDYAEFLENLDTQNFLSLIDLATSGGVVYKNGNETEFEEINNVFKNRTLGTILAYCDKKGISTREYDSEPMVLPTEAEKKVAAFGEEEWNMFFNGDSLAFHNKHGKVSKKDELTQLKQRILESVETTKTNSVKKTF